MYEERTERRPSTLPLFLVALVVLLLGWKVVDEVMPGFRLHQDAESRPVTARGDLAQDEQSTIALFEGASRSVVHIETKAVRRTRYSTNVLEIPQGTGSGFIWDDGGYVVTNFHVIKDASRADVLLADGSRYDARLVGFAADYDLAVLKIGASREDLPAIPVGTSNDLRVGQKVFAIGNPFGLDQTLTTGIISGLEREILSVTQTPIRGVIQTDAAINPGNSGGPLLDSAGRLIGVNTAIYSPSGGSSGIGFAVPVDTVNAVVPELIRTGRPERPGLGVVLALDAIARRRYGAKGAMIEEVVPGSGAQKAGLLPLQGRQFDDIISIDGTPVREAADVPRLLANREVGDRVAVEFLRGGDRREVDVVLSALP